MKLSRYTIGFAGVVFFLTGTALMSYREISATIVTAEAPAVQWISDSAAVPARALGRGTMPTYDAVAARDAAWLRVHARPYSLTEIRARGDGQRSPRQRLQDRVYAHSKAGRADDAIRELERWTRDNPRDSEAIVWLARLLNETGRRDDSVRRYRQALAAEGALEQR